MAQIRVVGFDPSLNNWGMASAICDTETRSIVEVEELGLITPETPSGKTIRNNSKDLSRATQLYATAEQWAEVAEVLFVEVPHGSQSARSMASYGICIGVLGAIANTKPFIQLTANEVKMATVGKKTATKHEMIEWAMKVAHCNSWPYHMHNGKRTLTEGKAEHMADAVATIFAGLETDQFKQIIALLR